MAKDYLLSFLEKRFFSLKTGDDQLLQKLRAAVGTLAEKLQTDRKLVIPCTLVALDPDTPIGDPVFDAVASAVQEQWNTYTEVFAEPRTVFRAILLDALASTAEREVGAAGAIDLICRNAIPHLQSGGETEIITRFRDRARELAQAEAEKWWPSEASVTRVESPVFRLGQLRGNKIGVDREALKAGFPRPAWNNQHWVSNSQQLLDVIVNQGTEAIAVAIEGAVAAGGISTDDLKKSFLEPLQIGLKAFADSITASLASIIAPIATLKRQEDLLWWKAAAYSDHLKQSYREVPASLLPLAFAVDLGSLLPPWNPIVVEHFLAEAFLDRSPSNVAKEEAAAPNLRSYLETTKAEDRLPELLNDLPPNTLPKSTGRSTLLAFVAEISRNAGSLDDLLPKTGLAPTLAISEVELCLHFFREIQAERLLSTEPEGQAE